MHIEGSSAIVTGAASGLGAATAAALAAAGAHVSGFDLDITHAPSLSGVSYQQVDVTDDAAVRLAVERAAERTPLRIVVNCAGIAPGSRILGRHGVHSTADFARVVTVNLIGTFTVLALAAERIAATEPLTDGQRGVIINTASIAAFEGQIGQAAYASSKGGVVGLTLPAARDLAQHGIRVNTIAPGIVETPMLVGLGDQIRANLSAGVPFPKRLALPREYARLATFLIEHDYINGEVVRMDGALRMAPR
ncbi:SDR family NAD(P)-dependent oxidoreductase [Nakamurella leprariae]|uniref:SDR family oxidoreductase n=1 Tax=Nakamurella leprariae TaxID=2803911 RepID=A0A938YG83_9ACTN|nr:SDR family NAD(P)-dependent oxidoreductase [Nakamurella leprariae]MBM9467812.1 SDR family oxidoreductase [Nakamurella leprariae]